MTFSLDLQDEHLCQNHQYKNPITFSIRRPPLHSSYESSCGNQNLQLKQQKSHLHRHWLLVKWLSIMAIFPGKFFFFLNCHSMLNIQYYEKLPYLRNRLVILSENFATFFFCIKSKKKSLNNLILWKLNSKKKFALLKSYLMLKYITKKGAISRDYRIDIVFFFGIDCQFFLYLLIIKR